MDKLAESVQAYEEIAAANGPWAQDAALRADYTRAQQRIRGLPVTEKPAPATAPTS